MVVLVIGGTGRIGGLTVDAAVAAGHEVRALVRGPDRIVPRPGLTTLQGDLRQVADLRRAVSGVEAVIAAAGPRSNSAEEETALELGMRNLIAAMEGAGVARLVTLSGAGVDAPGDRKPLADRAMSWLVRRFATHVVGAKQREFDVMAGSGLAWTALRPPLVIDGTERGYELSLTLRPGVRVTRRDVARALADQVTDRTFEHAAPFVLPVRTS